jgi:hypothetical protein
LLGGAFAQGSFVVGFTLAAFLAALAMVVGRIGLPMDPRKRIRRSPLEHVPLQPLLYSTRLGPALGGLLPHSHHLGQVATGQNGYRRSAGPNDWYCPLGIGYIPDARHRGDDYRVLCFLKAGERYGLPCCATSPTDRARQAGRAVSPKPSVSTRQQTPHQCRRRRRSVRGAGEGSRCRPSARFSLALSSTDHSWSIVGEPTGNAG